MTFLFFGMTFLFLGGIASFELQPLQNPRMQITLNLMRNRRIIGRHL